jgi:hypothetical protein
MDRGFECGDEFFQVIYDLSSELMKHLAENPNLEIEATQVKHKLNSLRYYIRGGDKEAYKIIEKHLTPAPVLPASLWGLGETGNPS